MATADSVKTKIQGLITKANNTTGRSDADMTNAVDALVEGYNPDGIIPSGTKSITTNGTHDITTYASASVNVPIPSGYIKPSGTKSITANGTHDVTNYASANVNVPVGVSPTGTVSITTNGTHDVTNYASASVNVPIPSGYVKPSGTLNITANGTHDVTNYASTSVNVPIPSGYIKPSGSLNITTNGTHNVTNYESAVVNVPVPTERMVVRTITIASDLGNGTNTTKTILTADSFVAAHYSHDGFFAMLVPATQIASATNVVHSVYHGNFNIGSTNVARYGFAYYSSSASAIANRVMTAKLNANSYNVAMRAKSTGNLDLYVESARIVKAGTYILTLGCWN